MLSLEKNKSIHTRNPKRNNPQIYKAKCSSAIKAEKEPIQNKNVLKIINVDWKIKYISP